MAEYTKGPWYETGASLDVESAITIAAGGGDEEHGTGETTVCEVLYGEADNRSYQTKGQARANARLIAAAPDLFAELRESTNCFIMLLNTDLLRHDMEEALSAQIEANRKAISKAEKGE